jgi:polyisoprenyl-teichoic acid--peptidoglycan teichoic acid transferase
MIKRAGFCVALLSAVSILVPVLGHDSQGIAAGVVGGRVHRSFQPEDGKLFILVIGNDARHGNPDAARADAIHIVGVDTRTMRGGILNFPRDSWVAIPGHGSGKINEALFDGGPKLLARTLEAITGIRIDYWVMTGFEGFQGIIRQIHGVRLAIRRDIFDHGGSGAHLSKGMHLLGGRSALAYVRTRHSFPRGDIDRTTNQARFLIAMLRELRRDMQGSPATVLRWIAIARRHTRLDISPDTSFRLGVLATQMSTRRVGNVTVPVSVGSVGSASVVFISPGARPLYARFRRTASL